MRDTSFRILLLGGEPGLLDTLRAILAQVEDRTIFLEWLEQTGDFAAILGQQDYEVYFIALDGGPDEAGAILTPASANHWTKPIIFLTGDLTPESRAQLTQAGAAGCLSRRQLNRPLIEYAIDHALEFARALQRIRQSEAKAQKLALVASRTENIVIITDAQGGIQWANDAFTRLTEYTLPEVRGATPGSFLQGPETDPETVAYMRERLSQGEGFKTEIINYSKSGREYWVQIEVQPFYNQAAELEGFTAIESDITERKRVEGELRLRDRAMGATAEGIVISDPNRPDNPLIYVNDGFERLTGYPRHEVLGRNCRFLQGPGTDPATLEQIRECIREPRECLLELLNYRKDGTPFWNRLSIAPLRDAKGRLTHFVGVQSDITARKHAEDSLAAANNRMLRDLEAAAKVQQALLPNTPPHMKGVEFAWLFKPTAELAGDQINVLQLDAAHVALYLLDVSGHGVPSALMAVAASLLLSRRPDVPGSGPRKPVGDPPSRLTSPAETALALNQQFLRENIAPHYLTLVYGMLNVESGTFRYVAAGHPGPVLVRSGAAPRALEAPTGLPIGLLAAAYEERTVLLRSGDRIYLYSDGVTEAMNASEEQFGVQRLLARLDEVHELPLEASLQALLQRVEEWQGHESLGDDVSLVALEWKK